MASGTSGPPIMRSQKAEAGTGTFRIRAGFRQVVSGSGGFPHLHSNSPQVAAGLLGHIRGTAFAANLRTLPSFRFRPNSTLRAAFRYRRSLLKPRPAVNNSISAYRRRFRISRFNFHISIHAFPFIIRCATDAEVALTQQGKVKP